MSSNPAHEVTMVATRQRAIGTTAAPAVPQYSKAGVIGTWAAAALPMASLAWVAAPMVAHRLHGATALSRALILALTAGMVWQFLLVLFLVHREQRTLRWSVVKNALWLNAPRRPAGGRRGGRAWLIVIPLILALAAEESLPTVPTPAARDLGRFLSSDAGLAFLSGNWVWLGIIVVLQIFNSVLGEELLFRGLLLPRMHGAFGRWDWAANGVLFALYHLHVPWVIPQTFVDACVPWAAKRYRSALVGIAAHSAQSVFFTVLVFGAVLK